MEQVLVVIISILQKGTGWVPRAGLKQTPTNWVAYNNQNVSRPVLEAISLTWRGLQSCWALLQALGRMWFQAFLEVGIASQPWHPLACSCSPSISASTLSWLSPFLGLSDDGLLLPVFPLLSSPRTLVTLDEGPPYSTWPYRTNTCTKLLSLQTKRHPGGSRAFTFLGEDTWVDHRQSAGTGCQLPVR